MTYIKEMKRTPEGAVQILQKDTGYVLIDYIQEYCSRVARAILKQAAPV